MSPKKDVYILGLAFFGLHDSCAVLLKNGEVIAACEEERFTRIKFDRSFPKNSIAYCLKKGNITIDKVDYAGYFWKPWVGILNRSRYYIQNFPFSFGDSQRASALLDQFKAEYIFRRETGFSGKFYFLDHHVTHAASVYFASGFKQAAILSLDGTGEKISCWMGKGVDNKITKLKSINWPHSVGQLYRTVTQYLGFEIFTDEYKVMGLSAYGKPTYLNAFKKILKTKNPGQYELDLTYFDYQFAKKRMYTDKWIKVFGPERIKGSPILTRHKDIAASLQKRTEEVILYLAKDLLKQVGPGPLCITGGVGLNSVANGKVTQSGIAEKVYISPVASDSGCALGAAYYIYYHILNNPVLNPLPDAYLGRDFTNKEIKKTLDRKKLSYSTLENPPKKAAQLIADGHVLGWFQGRSELGQRALGNRSILADARDKTMKDKVNRLVKYRESFRPFAPAILESHQSEYFTYPYPVPYMTEVYPIKKEKRKIIPSVVHIDGTGRIQTVLKTTNPRFWSLINEFYNITGVPVVLNTSFNVQGEPIVDSPDDAINTFLHSGLDDLIIDNFWIRKRV